jgi:hypothetical protein
VRHQDLQLNHRLESWVYANAAARTGATGFVAGDVGRIAYQTDTGHYWRLTATTPTWANINPTTATLQTAARNPAGTSSASPIMMGLGSGAGPAVITPVRSGKIFMVAVGCYGNNTTGASSSIAIWYGTGTPPVTGAAMTGTSPAAGVSSHSAAANQLHSFCCPAVVTGLTLNTQIWIDVGVWAGGGGTATAASITVTAYELP